MSKWHEEEGKDTQYVDDQNNKLYGDYMNVESKEKPQGELLAEYIIILTEQLLRTAAAIKADVSNCPITFVVKESADKTDVWTIGWKAYWKDMR